MDGYEGGVNALLCLEWCLEYGHRFPQDRKTAMHVLDWLAEKAKDEATTEADWEAIDRAIHSAKEVVAHAR